MPFAVCPQVTHSPPLVSICCSNGPARVKDTAANIAATRQFTVNIISEPWVEAANACAVDAPAEVGEWPLSGLTKAASLHVKPARVQESAFSMECEVCPAPLPPSHCSLCALCVVHGSQC